MSLSLEEFVIAILFLVPGFLETSARRAFRPKEFDSEFERVVSSLVFSLALNTPALIVALLASRQEAGEFAAWLQSVRTPWLGVYLIFIYVAALGIGTLRGAFPGLGLRKMWNRLGVTQYGDVTAVWDEVFEKHQPEHTKPWLWVRSKDTPPVFGRLRQSSALVHQDKPIEVVLKPCYRLENGRLDPVVDGAGCEVAMYRRLGEADVVEFHFMPENWQPHSEGAY